MKNDLFGGKPGSSRNARHRRAAERLGHQDHGDAAQERGTYSDQGFDEKISRRRARGPAVSDEESAVRTPLATTERFVAKNSHRRRIRRRRNNATVYDTPFFAMKASQPRGTLRGLTFTSRGGDREIAKLMGMGSYSARLI